MSNQPEKITPKKATFNQLDRKGTFVEVAIINKKNKQMQDDLERKKANNEELTAAKANPMFKVFIKKAFDKYDVDGSGDIDYHELKQFLNDLRACLNLPKTDDKVFKKIVGIIDPDKSKSVDLQEFYDN